MKTITKILGLILVLSILTNCNRNRPPTTIDGFEAIVIEPGNHRSDPWDLIVSKTDIKYRWYFSDGARYYTNPDSSNTGDQKDWNKLIGQSYTPWRLWTDANHINSAMVGERYNTTLDVFELNAYWHLDEERGFTAPLMTFEALQQFETQVVRLPGNEVQVCVEKFTDPDHGSFEAGNFCYSIDFTGQRIPDEVRQINTYHGGNTTPLNRRVIYRKRVN